MIRYPAEALEIDARLSTITEGLHNEFFNGLKSVSKENAFVIVDYISAMYTETNPSNNYRKDNIRLLYSFSKFNKDKVFKSITRDEVISFLNIRRKPEASDPLHKWVGTYNQYRIYLIRFFKWLFFPDKEQNKRPKPKVVNNIPALRRKEKSIYKPSDLWTEKDDLIFLKYCPSKRNKCFHAMSWDTSCRPHELLKLRIKDVSFKIFEKKQYAEVFVNGKTGTRHIPLIDSIPYLKDYLNNEHPQPENPNAILLCAYGKSINKVLNSQSLNRVYQDYKTHFFPRLLKDPNVPQEDKEKVQELLKKPWNPYIRRHSALTQKSKLLKEHTLRQYAGWTSNSNMPQLYIHYLGNEAGESLLEAYGITPKDTKYSNPLKSKQCPNCNEPNKPDARFCAKCTIVLTYDAYNETLQEQKEKEDKLLQMEEKFNLMQSQIRTLMSVFGSLKNQNDIDTMAKQLFQSGILETSK
ncbi:MAG: tyrosine-type recombinase/integrase [Nitrososphaeraceae archaeon]|nr:tyrosine-type recombinase/integrase [Nitrososphaeraceae archaeon]